MPQNFNYFEKLTIIFGTFRVNLLSMMYKCLICKFEGLSPRSKSSENSGKTPKGLSQSRTPGKYGKMPNQKGKTPSKTPNKQSGPDRSVIKLSFVNFTEIYIKNEWNISLVCAYIFFPKIEC